MPVPPKRTERKTLRVVELFAGVGGFRVGLNRASRGHGDHAFKTVWASQWEPATGKNQHAAWVYETVFFRNKGITDEAVIRSQFSNEDINKIVSDEELIGQIPDHDVLTGGFPCQDYSVARPLNQARGLEGKKGVLWWSIDKILQHKQGEKKPVPYLFLENVDRLLKSPVSKRGRDFAIILSRLSELGYIVEWRVVNAGEYGFPQRRRRTFILGYHKTSPIAKQFSDPKKWISRDGLLARAFPATPDIETLGEFTLSGDAVEITKNFVLTDVRGDVDSAAPFQNSGMMVNGRIVTQKVRPRYAGKIQTLGNIINDTVKSDVDDRFYITEAEQRKWEKQKEAHAFERTSKSGHAYRYTEGALPFPDKLDRPSRTIITSEGGRSPSRFKHVVEIAACKRGGKVCNYRRLTPEELEALCMFDRGHTRYMYVPSKKTLVGVPDTRRAFFMGNALVVGVIERIGRELLKRHSAAPSSDEKSSLRRVPALAGARAPK